MSDQQCDIHDVTKSAADLVALGCTLGATHLFDSIAQLQFSSVVSSYANEIVRAVDEGIISAWEGVQEIRAEFAELDFYARNIVGVAAGAIQVKVGSELIVATKGVAAPVGGLMLAHGANNMYEGGMNLLNGPDVPVATGWIREIYRGVAGGDYEGDMVYGTLDLGLSIYGMTRLVPRKNQFDVPKRNLFRKDPRDYERAHKQTGKVALFFEALVDAITVRSMASEKGDG